MRLLLLLLAVPLIEIALFVQIGGAVGLFTTLAVVALTAAAGAVLLRRQGLAVLRHLSHAASAGGDLAEPLLHGLMIFSSGLLLLTPGFFTDAAGFALLIPSVREALIRWGAKTVASEVAAFSRRPGPRRDDGVIEGSAREVSAGTDQRPEARSG